MSPGGWRDPTLADPELLEDATSSFLHVSLEDQHSPSPFHRPLPPASLSISPSQHVRTKRRSLEDLRAPPGFSGASTRSKGSVQNLVGLGAGVGEGSTKNPFADSPQLLRRCSSFQAVDGLGGPEQDDAGLEDEDDESEFSSDVSLPVVHRPGRDDLSILLPWLRKNPFDLGHLL